MPTALCKKFSHTLYRALGPELIPVYSSQPAGDFWVIPVGGCLYFPPGLWSPSQPKMITVLRPVPSYTAWWQRHIGVNNLPKVVMQLCLGGNWMQLQHRTAMPLCVSLMILVDGLLCNLLPRLCWYTTTSCHLWNVEGILKICPPCGYDFCMLVCLSVHCFARRNVSS